jgi:AbrB family looped-hinge helix DNA binding protein
MGRMIGDRIPVCLGRASRDQALCMLHLAHRADRESAGIVLPMETKIDAVGRVVVPKPLRDALGLSAGSTVDISRYGPGLQLVPAGRTARLVEEAEVLVATGETVIDDDTVFGLIDAGRR